MPFRSPRRQCPTWTSPFVPGNPDLGTRSPHSAASRRPSALRTMTTWAASPCWLPTRDLRPTAHRDVAGRSSDACRVTARARPRSSAKSARGRAAPRQAAQLLPRPGSLPPDDVEANRAAEARSAGSRHLTRAAKAHCRGWLGQIAPPAAMPPDRAAGVRLVGTCHRIRVPKACRRTVSPRSRQPSPRRSSRQTRQPQPRPAQRQARSMCESISPRPSSDVRKPRCGARPWEHTVDYPIATVEPAAIAP